MVGRRLPNSTATGRPTYPRPTTATVGRVISETIGRSRTSGMDDLAFFLDQVGRVPVDGALQALVDAQLGLVAEQALRLADVGARVLEVALARLAEQRLEVLQARQALRHQIADLVEQLGERGLVAELFDKIRD